MNAGKILPNYQRNWFFRFQCVYVQHNFTVPLFADRRDTDEIGAGFPWGWLCSGLNIICPHVPGTAHFSEFWSKRFKEHRLNPSVSGRIPHKLPWTSSRCAQTQVWRPGVPLSSPLVTHGHVSLLWTEGQFLATFSLLTEIPSVIPQPTYLHSTVVQI